MGENGSKLGASRVYCVYKIETQKVFVPGFIVSGSTTRIFKPKTQQTSHRVRMAHLVQCKDELQDGLFKAHSHVVLYRIC